MLVAPEKVTTRTHGLRLMLRIVCHRTRVYGKYFPFDPFPSVPSTLFSLSPRPTLEKQNTFRSSENFALPPAQKKARSRSEVSSFTSQSNFFCANNCSPSFFDALTQIRFFIFFGVIVMRLIFIWFLVFTPHVSRVLFLPSILLRRGISLRVAAREFIAPREFSIRKRLF